MMQSFASESLEKRLSALQARGVIILDPRQVYLDEHVALDRICKDVLLCPGTRLTGPRTFLGPYAKVATEGPAVLNDAILAENAEVASGYVSGAVLLRAARLGANCHVRSGTLLEEQ